MSKDSSTNLRTVGALFLSLGSASTYFTIIQPLQLAQSGASSITTSRSLTVLSPILIIYGITYLLFPRFVEQYLGSYPRGKPSNSSSKAGWIFAIVSIMIGVGIAFWVDSYLKAYNYGF